MAGGGFLLGCLVEGVGSGPESFGKNTRAPGFSFLCIFSFFLPPALWILPHPSLCLSVVFLASSCRLQVFIPCLHNGAHPARHSWLLCGHNHSWHVDPSPPPVRCLCPLASHTCPRQPLVCSLSLQTIFVAAEVSCKWYHALFVLGCLASFSMFLRLIPVFVCPVGLTGRWQFDLWVHNCSHSPVNFPIDFSDVFPVERGSLCFFLTGTQY